MKFLSLVILLFSSVLYEDSWIDYATHILSGETVPYCDECDKWIACTLIQDAEKRIEAGISPYTLYPNRWHGWRDSYSDANRKNLEYVLYNGCEEYPACTFLGNLSDYQYWLGSYANLVPSHVIGNTYGAIVCIPYDSLPVHKYESPTNIYFYE